MGGGLFNLFVDVSGKKVAINFMLLNVFEHKTEERMSFLKTKNAGDTI